MSESLEAAVQATENLAEKFRNTDMGWQPYVFPDEYTNWIEEQRAVKESCAVVDQSYHQHTLEIEGSEALAVLSRLGINSLEKFRMDDPPQAINYVTCNPDGYVIGDVILFYLKDDDFVSVGSEWIHNWISYHAEQGYDNVRTEVLYDPLKDDIPPDFRFQIQGPDAAAVMEAIADQSFPALSLFDMDIVTINGVQTHVLGHGMAASRGWEIFGPHRHHDDVLGTILEAGDQYGIRQMGSKAYKTGKIGIGWFVMAVPAIYESNELTDYRRWLSADCMEANLSIGGSFQSDDITDYYMTPMEHGQAHLIDFDHDFIGKSALQKMIDTPQRSRVTLVWDADDVINIYSSLFQEGETHQFLDIPDTATQWSETHYDKIIQDGEVVGISKYPGYLYYEREMLSLATIDPELSEPGTQVSFIWGDNSGKDRVERNKQMEVRATIAPSPYLHGGRENM